MPSIKRLKKKIKSKKKSNKKIKSKKKSNKKIKSKKKSNKKKIIKKGGEVLSTGLNKKCIFGVDSDICSTDNTLKSISKQLEMGGNVDKKEIIETAKKNTGCDTESCLYSKMNNLDDIKNSVQRFKEKGPANTLDWLDNNNIDNVLKKWSHIFPGFKHIPFHMIDFDKSNTYLHSLDLNTIIKEGYTSAGVVLNTDISSGSGIHWFCLFFDFRSSPITIEYFNSSGLKPVSEIRVLLNRIKIDNSIIIENTMSHQRDTGSECGLYSLYYIINRLKGIPYTDFNKRVPDSEMIKLRKDVFTD